MKNNVKALEDKMNVAVSMVYSETLNLLNTCFKNGHDNHKQAYGSAVNRISDFIVANNVTPITRSALENSNRRIFSEGHKGETLDKVCASDLMPAKDKDMDEEGLKRFQTRIDKLLSAPRPPVMNPCL